MRLNLPYVGRIFRCGSVACPRTGSRCI